MGVDHDRIGVLRGEPVDRGLSAMGGPVVDDPEDTLGRGVGLVAHHVMDQRGKRCDAGGGVTPSEHPPVADVVGRQIRQRPTASIVIVHAHRLALGCR